MHTIDLIHQFEDSQNGLPVWIHSQNLLLWLDNKNHLLYQYDANKQSITSNPISDPIISLSPSKNHGFIATLKDGIGYYDFNEKKVIYISKPEPFRPNQLLAGVADKDGSYWSFTQSERPEDKSSLYKISENKQTKRYLGEHFQASAPPSFSIDGSKLYQSTGRSRYIYCTSFDEERNPISTENFTRISKAEGYPHGLSVDNQDNLWVCHREAGLISCYSPEGECIEKIEINAPGIEYCTFGGKDLRELFIITSEASGIPSRRKFEYSNALIKIKTDAQGIEAHAFTG